MKKILSAVAAVAALSFTNGAFAEDKSPFSYDHADISYEHTFYDERGVDNGKGVNVSGTVSPIDNFFLELSYGYSHTNAVGLGVDLQAFIYGGGAYYNVADNVDVVAGVAGVYEHARVESLGTDDTNGYLLSAGVRTLPFCNNVEVEVGATYVDLSGADSTWTYGAETIVPVADALSAKAGVSINDDTDVGLSAGLRYDF